MSEAPQPTRSGRVALVGRPNVGKSTLLNALLGEPLAIISPHPQTTREPVRGVLTRGSAQYVFVDTPGLHDAKTRLGHRMNDQAQTQAREADAVVLVVETRADERDLALARRLGELVGDVPAVLVLNKVDKLKDKVLLLPVIAAFSDVRAFAAVVPMSARRGDGADRLLDALGELLPVQEMLYPPDTLSDQPERFFVAELVREQILAHTRQEVPHGVAVVIERFEEGKTVTHIEVAVHVAREGHKGILVGAKGSMMKAIGTAARLRVEKMLGRKVHLAVRVRATPGWMDDPAKLAELGYGGDGR
jgi:GTP-binding protein Era